MRILIVEDDPLLGEALRDGLRQRQHGVDWFTDGRSADAALAATPYDAVVLDLGLPGGDGMQWLARWRGGEHAQLPILVLTARDGVADRIAGLDAGADDYLVKPITLDELAARLRALLRRSSGRGQALWQHGDLEYDPAARSVRWRGTPVDLTAREIALLEALMAEPHRVLSRSYLQDKLYPWDDAVESNALEVHVHHLRRKLDRSVVRTLRGVGYALGAATGSAGSGAVGAGGAGGTGGAGETDSAAATDGSGDTTGAGVAAGTGVEGSSESTGSSPSPGRGALPP